MPIAARSNSWVCNLSLTGSVGSNSAKDMDVWLLWVLSDRGLCGELITCPEEFYRMWCVVLCVWPRNLENEEPVTRVGPQRHGNNILTFYSLAVSLCTTRFNIQKILHGARFALSVLYGSQNRQRHLLYTALTGWFL